MQRFCFRVEAGVAVEARDTLGTDDRENSVSASGSLLLFMEAGVFGSPRPPGGQCPASGASWHGGG
jgi:hypothetical protein